ncbi:DNA gyrase inhibitor YacG [Saccharobesus litoralis]|uniref:DNA gyrase inhibitor YacG n=1 Tax=Saccharobesus litoralis TaxID=2172099 RepID=A0A2S0VX87_9ALTE|nr:DNA gyrase inhibitor YacG [Saccharobesus litoralis]AWB68730.1 DNA gyrase inhibitor YacG [Saccharobesus litoralis]
MLKVNCPTCDTQVTWSKESQYKPFCSERCKLIDLGEWSEESRVIKGQSLKQSVTGKVDEFDIEEELAKFNPDGESFFLED